MIFYLVLGTLIVALTYSLNVCFDLLTVTQITKYEDNKDITILNNRKIKLPTTFIGKILNAKFSCLLERINFLESCLIQEQQLLDRRIYKNINLSSPIEDVFLSTVKRLAEERKNISIKLKISGEKEKASEFMLSAMSHDMRSPLSNIQTALKLIENDTDDIKTRRLAEISFLNCLNLESQISEIIDYLKCEAGAIKTTTSYFAINSIISDAIKNLSLKAQINSCEINNIISHELMINADPNHAYRILINILGNSIRHSKNGKIFIDYEKNSDYSVIIIEDFGSGISDDKFKKLFIPFACSNDNNPESVGLGMYITKNLIELNGGKIEVESTIGVGTKFKLYFCYKQDTSPRLFKTY